MVRIGVICPSEIALRRFMPALKKASNFEFVGISSYSAKERFGDAEEYTKEQLDKVASGMKKAEVFVEQYGGRIFESFEELCSSDEIDAVYIPLPPALHYKWAKYALEQGKHVFLEKPSTLSASHTRELVNLAKEKVLALHENYMFVFHKQLMEVEQLIADGEIGDVRLYRVAFGFPRRAEGDFRYSKEMGGGAVNDAGGYVIKYADMLLKKEGRILCATSCADRQTDVDISGTVVMANEDGVTVQAAFGMENEYKCELEAWGSKGVLRHDRILTAPAGFEPCCLIKHGQEEKKLTLSEDDTFFSSLIYFEECIASNEVREESYENIVRQAELVDDFKNKTNLKGI